VSVEGAYAELSEDQYEPGITHAADRAEPRGDEPGTESSRGTSRRPASRQGTSVARQPCTRSSIQVRIGNTAAAAPPRLSVLPAAGQGGAGRRGPAGVLGAERRSFGLV